MQSPHRPVPHSPDMLGAAAEQRALELLQRQGLKLLARNWRCRGGELDLVMRDGAELVFVEVRARSRADFGGAAASIDAHKRARLIHAARSFLAAHAEHAEAATRFDVIAFEGGAAPHWLRAAFDNDG